jgi:hypothetical protein
VTIPAPREPPRGTNGPGTLAAGTGLLGGTHVRGLLVTAAEKAGATLASWSLRSIHRRGDRSVSAVYEAELTTDGGRREVLLVAHLDIRGLPPGTLELTDGDLRIGLWRFPHDPYLPGLTAAVHRGRVRELLDVLDGPPGEVDLHTRSYRPSRRAVVEVTVTGPERRGRVLYLKVLAGDRAAELAGLHRQLANHLPVPGVVGVAPRQGIVALEALGGTTLRTTIVEDGPLPDPGELVELSRRLAGSGLRSRRDPVAFADPTRHVDHLCALVPDQRARLHRLAARLDGPTGPRGVVHGDLHDGQLLCDDGRVVGLLDVDGAGTGHLAQDAGSLVAHLEAIAEVWPRAAGRAGAYAEAVASAYRAVVGSPAMARAAAGAWLGLATGPHRAQDPGWAEATRRRIRRAATWARLL